MRILWSKDSSEISVSIEMSKKKRKYRNTFKIYSLNIKKQKLNYNYQIISDKYIDEGKH